MYIYIYKWALKHTFPLDQLLYNSNQLYEPQGCQVVAEMGMLVLQQYLNRYIINKYLDILQHREKGPLS